VAAKEGYGVIAWAFQGRDTSQGEKTHTRTHGFVGCRIVGACRWYGAPRKADNCAAPCRGGMEGKRDGMNGRSTNRVRRQKCGREWRIGPDKSTDRTRSRPSERNPTGVGLTLALHPPARKAKKSIRWLIKMKGGRSNDTAVWAYDNPVF
jgi:hypothetical protein